MVQQPREQHLVSRVVLNRWAAGGNIETYALRYGSARLRSPRAEGWEEGFVAFEASRAEERWGEIETRAPDAFAAVDSETIFDEPQLLDVLRDLLALHFARSKTMRRVYERVLSRGDPREHLDQIDQMLEDPDFVDGLFLDTYGLHPAGPGARLLIVESYVEQLAEKFGRGGALFSKQVQDDFQAMRTKARGWPIEIAVVRDEAAELLVGDDPVQTLDWSGRRVGIIAGVTIADADALVFPIGPKHIITPGRSNTFFDLPPEYVPVLNAAQVAAAEAKVYYRPSADGLRSFVDEGAVRWRAERGLV